MAIVLAGIDEAGYGPILGPLVVACCTLRIGRDDCTGPDGPDVWQMLRRAASPTRDRTGRRVHVADSKKVHAGPNAAARLESAVLPLAAWFGLGMGRDEVLLAACDGVIDAPWYVPTRTDRVPPATGPTANLLRIEADSAGVRPVSWRAAVLCETEYNRQCDALRNKAAVLFGATAAHLDGLLRRHRDGVFGTDDLLVVCDRHGGRSSYGSLLRLMFPDHAADVVAETPERAEYELTACGRTARIVFREKAESVCFCTAAASMLAKYVRECLMDRFNGWWTDRVPGVRPTAGYWQDGLRFLEDTRSARQALGVPDDRLARRR